MAPATTEAAAGSGCSGGDNCRWPLCHIGNRKSGRTFLFAGGVMQLATSGSTGHTGRYGRAQLVTVGLYSNEQCVAGQDTTCGNAVMQLVDLAKRREIYSVVMMLCNLWNGQRTLHHQPLCRMRMGSKDAIELTRCMNTLSGCRKWELESHGICCWYF